MWTAILMLSLLQADPPEELLTVAEQSGFRATATHAEVMELVARLDARSPRLTRLELGRSFEGRELPLLVLADPPVATPAQARASGKLVLFAFGDIHAGEVCGKEALLMLARELALAPDPPLLEHAVVVLAPIYNADGNDRMSTGNRPGQVGPELGMGQRPNAQGLDLNRDWVKLEAPETRALVRFLTSWDPDLVIDTHTTNGSYHRYVLTYAPPLCPAGDPAPVAFLRDVLLPRTEELFHQRTGWRLFPYGNFDRERTRWSTYSPDPRFGGPYRGLRGRLSVLSEAYAYATYEDRVRATLAFVRTSFDVAVEHAGEVRALATGHDASMRETARPIPLRFEPDSGGRATVAAWVEQPDEGGRPRPTGQELDVEVELYDRFRATLSVERPEAYAIPAQLDGVIRNLLDHGVRLQVLDSPVEREVEAYTVVSIERAERPFQGHRLLRLEVEPAHRETRALAAGTVLASTRQPLGDLIGFLLEPQSQDGLVAWNFLDGVLEPGQEYPILRLPASQ